MLGKKSKEDPFTILIDYSASEFACVDAHVSGGGAEPQTINYSELNQQISKYKSIGEVPVIFFPYAPKRITL